jgi:hypothetical protein
MFKGIAGFLNKAREEMKDNDEAGEAGVGINVPKEERKGSTLGTLGLSLGMKFMVKGGVVSSKAAKKLLKYKMHPDAVTAMVCIQNGDYDRARELVLNEDFIAENDHFLRTGQIVRNCIEQGAFDLADELVDAGYSFPRSVLLDLIKDERYEMLRNAIGRGYHKRLDEVVVEFWYLLN